MRAACLSAFVEDIRDGRVDSFYVKINKEMTISQKNTAMSIGRRELEAFRATSIAYEELQDHDLRAMMFTEKIEAGQFFFSGKFKDKCYLFSTQERAREGGLVAYRRRRQRVHRRPSCEFNATCVSVWYRPVLHAGTPPHIPAGAPNYE